MMNTRVSVEIEDVTVLKVLTLEITFPGLGLDIYARSLGHARQGNYEVALAEWMGSDGIRIAVFLNSDRTWKLKPNTRKALIDETRLIWEKLKMNSSDHVTVHIFELIISLDRLVKLLMEWCFYIIYVEKFFVSVVKLRYIVR
jgi:hypothetical protein